MNVAVLVHRLAVETNTMIQLLLVMMWTVKLRQMRLWWTLVRFTHFLPELISSCVTLLPKVRNLKVNKN